MKNHSAIALALLALIFSLLACNVIVGDNQVGETVTGSGPVVEQVREVSGFSGVELAMTGTLHITMGDTSSLRIEAQENLMEYIQTEVRGDTLRIQTPPRINVKVTRPIQYYLTVENLEEIEVSSSGDIEATGITSDSFSIRINSSGKVTIDSLDCSSLDVRISSSGDTNISSLTAEKLSVDISSSGTLRIAEGQLQQQEIDISSSGDYDAKNVPSATAEITISSSGSATVRVSERISGRLTSSGNIYYAGSPEVDVSTTSSGRVIQID